MNEVAHYKMTFEKH